MIKFIDRDSFIFWIKNHVSQRSIIRAIEEGTVEYLGGFSRTELTPQSPVWVCRITSIYNRVWIIASYTDGTVCHLDHIPWKYYAGGNSKNTLYSGDNPANYRKLRYLARTNSSLNLKQKCK